MQTEDFSSDQLVEILNAIPEQLDATRNYWFFRTSSGDFFDTFFENNFVAIGYNDLTLAQIESAMKVAEETFLNQPDTEEYITKKNKKKITRQVKKKSLDYFQQSYITALVQVRHPDEIRPFYIGRQLQDFIYKIKSNDIIIIPSAGSTEFGIGIVQSDEVYIEPDDKLTLQQCHYNKRKQVRWIKKVNRAELDPKLFKVIYAHRTITKLDEEYAGLIDRIIGTLYKKGDKCHLVLQFNKKENIKANELFTIWPELFNLVESFSHDHGIPFDPDSIEAKINLQSPGVIELIENWTSSNTLISLFIYIIVGGKISFTTKAGMNFQAGGGGILGYVRIIIELIEKWETRSNKQAVFKSLKERFKNNELDEEKIFSMMNHYLGVQTPISKTQPPSTESASNEEPDHDEDTANNR